MLEGGREGGKEWDLSMIEYAVVRADVGCYSNFVLTTSLARVYRIELLQICASNSLQGFGDLSKNITKKKGPGAKSTYRTINLLSIIEFTVYKKMLYVCILKHSPYY